MADLGFFYLFRNPNRFLETWAHIHILALISCSVWTKITQPLTFLLIPKKRILKCKNKFSTWYVCASTAVVSVKKLQWIGHFSRFYYFFSWKSFNLYNKSEKCKPSEGKMCKIKIAQNIPSYNDIFFLFWWNLKMREVGPKNIFFFIINQSISQNHLPNIQSDD